MISVIIPVLNEEKYIKGCLDSILDQTYTNLEIIVVDNGSTDSTKEIVKTYRNVILSDEPVRGVSNAKNKGAKIAKGDILYFSDADCRLRKEYLELLKNKFENDNQLVATGGPYVYRDGNALHNFITQNYYFYYFHKFIALLFDVYTLGGGSFAILKDKFFTTTGFNPEIGDIVIPEDLDFCIKLRKLNYKVVMFKDLWVLSSARRQQKKGALKEGIRRAVATFRMLIKVGARRGI